jgi:hypothetical protein
VPWFGFVESLSSAEKQSAVRRRLAALKLSGLVVPVLD